MKTQAFLIIIIVLLPIVLGIEIGYDNGTTIDIRQDSLDEVFNTSFNYTWTGHNIFWNITLLNYSGITFDIVNRSDYWGTYYYSDALDYFYPANTNPNGYLTTESDPNYFSNPLGYYNSSTLPSYPAETDSIAIGLMQGNDSKWSSTYNASYLTAETDSNYFNNPLGYYNSTTLPAETDSIAIGLMQGNESAWLSTYNSSYLTSFTEQDLIAIGLMQGNDSRWIADTNVTTQCTGSNIPLGNGSCIAITNLGNNSFNQTLSDSLYPNSKVDILGSALTGSDGAKNRTYTINQPKMIYVDGWLLTNVTDYIYESGYIKFLNYKWNDQRITIWM